MRRAAARSPEARRKPSTNPAERIVLIGNRDPAKICNLARVAEKAHTATSQRSVTPSIDQPAVQERSELSAANFLPDPMHRFSREHRQRQLHPHPLVALDDRVAHERKAPHRTAPRFYQLRRIVIVWIGGTIRPRDRELFDLPHELNAIIGERE